MSLINNPREHPATHARGTQCIDFIFGSLPILKHVRSAGINSFYETPYSHSDHRGMFVDLDELSMFGATLHTIAPPIPRKIVSTSKTLIQKFLSAIEAQNTIQDISRQLEVLRDTPLWTPQHHNKLEQLDVIFTKTLLKAEDQCVVPTEYAWSPQLDKVSSIYNYWSIKISASRNNIDASETLSQIATTMSDNELYQGLNSKNSALRTKKIRGTAR
jgi:hypothetical protein